METLENHRYRVKNGMKLYEQVLSQIREMISNGLYQKGDMLPSEKELMELTGVSRITVREALRLLNESGVIETKRGKGSFVCIDSEELQKFSEDGNDYRTSFLRSTDARILLEPSIAASLAKNKTDEMLAQISRSFQNGQSPAAFHLALVSAVNNPIIDRWFSETAELETAPFMSRIIPPARQTSIASALESQHQKIFMAIQSGQETAAYHAMKEHLEYVRSMYEAYFNTFFS